jgi:hypothetical protein
MYSVMLTHYLTSARNERSTSTTTSDGRHEILHRPGNETDILALRLLGRNQPRIAG